MKYIYIAVIGVFCGLNGALSSFLNAHSLEAAEPEPEDAREYAGQLLSYRDWINQ